MSQKRREIVQAAAALMESNGYESTKLSDILAASQTGKGQFYYYFTSKHELGLAVIDYFFESFNKNLLGDILGSNKAPEVKLDEMLHWILSFHQSRHARCGCVFGNLALEMSEHDEAFRKKVNDVFKNWAEKIQVVLCEMCPDENRSAEAARLSQSIVAMIEGGILLMKSNQDMEPLRDITGWIKKLVGLFAGQYALETT